MAVPAAQEDEDTEAREWCAFGNELARRFYAEMGCVVREGHRFDTARHPQERLCWRLAVIACEEYDGTDIQELADQIDE